MNYITAANMRIKS